MSNNKTDYVAKHSYIPFGIENPRNHCYLKSILQVMFSIFHHRPVDNVNNNSDGEIIRYIHDISNSKLSAANTLLLKIVYENVMSSWTVDYNKMRTSVFPSF